MDMPDMPSEGIWRWERRVYPQKISNGCIISHTVEKARGFRRLQCTWSKTPGKLWKVGETADGGARENPVFPPFLRLAAASIRRCCTCVPGVFDQMRAGSFVGDGSSAAKAASGAVGESR